MTSAVGATPAVDYTDVPHVVRSGVRLGVLEAGLVAALGVASRALSGGLETAVLAALLSLGVAATITLPGLWTRARSIEGIAGAAGIGLCAAGAFLVIDVALLQPLGLYTNRWREIGGGSNWWYHPIWWMVGTYLPWMGAWVMANQRARSGAPNPMALVLGTLLLAAAWMTVAVLVGFPGARFGVATFGVATLPALPLLVVFTAWGARHR
jgi:hypothetical protein